MTVSHQHVSANRMSLRYVMASLTAGALVAMATLDTQPSRLANGLACSILLVYMTYTLLLATGLRPWLGLCPWGIP